MIPFLLLLVAPWAWAQVTPKEVYQCALRQIVLNQQENVLRARITRADARAQFLPDLSATLGPSAARQGNFPSNSNLASVSLAQRVIDFESLSNIDATDSALSASRLELLQQGLESSFLSLEDLGQIRIFENQLALYEGQLKSYKLSEEVMSTGSKLGVSDSNDLLQVRSTVDFLKAEINRLQFEVLRRRSFFRARYGYDAIPLTDIISSGSPADVDVARLPAAVALNARIEQSRFEKLVYQRRLWPDLSLQASYTSAQSAWPSSAIYPSRSAAIAVVLDLSGFWRESEQRAIQDPLIQTRINRLSFTVRNLKAEYEQLNAEIDLLKRQQPILRHRVEVTQKSREVSQAKLRLGRLSFLELQQSEQSAYSASQESYLVDLRLLQLNLRKEMAGNYDSYSREKSECRL